MTKYGQFLGIYEYTMLECVDDNRHVSRIECLPYIVSFKI